MKVRKPGFDFINVKKWEYLEILISKETSFVGEIVKKISNAGREGWELVSVIPEQPYVRGVSHSPERWIFKKEIIEHVGYDLGIDDDFPTGYTIEESKKYPGCFNIYNDDGSRVCYFAENDDLNFKRAKQWVKEQSEG